MKFLATPLVYVYGCVCVSAFLGVKQGETNRNRCTQRLVISSSLYDDCMLAVFHGKAVADVLNSFSSSLRYC